MIEKPADIVWHIIGEELDKGFSVIDSTLDVEGKTGHQRAVDAHPDWKMAFTVNKRINSKKLIEGIAKESRLFPFFKGNKLSFNSILDAYESADFEIKDSDVISYSFNRTKIEDIKTKVILNYHHNYATDEFKKSTESNANDGDTAEELFLNEVGDDTKNYKNSYYGIEGEQGGDPIEVKYIRHDETAEKLQRFLLAWYCNQHSTCKIKLPLSYLYAEIGDITAFPALLNGRKAYGEDYSLGYLEAVIRNGQQILPYWMIMGVNKTLEYVELDLIQMHNLGSSLTDFAPTADFVFRNEDGDIITSIEEDMEVELDGSLSFDPDAGSEIESYLWTPPAGIEISDNTGANPTFVAPTQDPFVNTSYSFGLVVTSNEVPSNPINKSLMVTDVGFPAGSLVNAAGTCGILLTSEDFDPDPSVYDMYIWNNIYWVVRAGYDEHPDSGSFDMLITGGVWRLLKLRTNSYSYDTITVSYDGESYTVPPEEDVIIFHTESGGDTISFNMEPLIPPNTQQRTLTAWVHDEMDLPLYDNSYGGRILRIYHRYRFD